MICWMYWHVKMGIFEVQSDHEETWTQDGPECENRLHPEMLVSYECVEGVEG